MVALSELDEQRALFHLAGARGGIPAGDLARIIEAVRNIPDDKTVGYIQVQLDNCDVAFNDIKDAAKTQTVMAETYAGDINRTVARAQKNLQVAEFYWKIYYMHVDQLARTLWCPEFRTPDSDYYRFARSGGEYVNSLPGQKGEPGDIIYLPLQYA